MSHKRPVSTGRVGERTSLYVTIALKASPVFILLQVRVLAPAEEKINRKVGLLFFLRRPEKRSDEGPSYFSYCGPVILSVAKTKR